MPIKIVSPEEWFALTGERGSIYIGPAAKRPKNQEVFLCPQCYEVLSSPSPGVFECAACGKVLNDARAEPSGGRHDR
jgi:hypothetical protein